MVVVSCQALGSGFKLHTVLLIGSEREISITALRLTIYNYNIAVAVLTRTKVFDIIP